MAMVAEAPELCPSAGGIAGVTPAFPVRGEGSIPVGRCSIATVFSSPRSAKIPCSAKIRLVGDCERWGRGVAGPLRPTRAGVWLLARDCGLKTTSHASACCAAAEARALRELDRILRGVGGPSPGKVLPNRAGVALLSLGGGHETIPNMFSSAKRLSTRVRK